MLAKIRWKAWKNLRAYIPRLLNFKSLVNVKLKGKPAGGKTLLYICKNYACQNPLESVEEFKGSHSTFTKL